MLNPKKSAAVEKPQPREYALAYTPAGAEID